MTDDNVFQRIDRAFKLIAANPFTKSGQVLGGQKYNFIPIGQILGIVRSAHSECGIKVIFGTPEYDEDNHERRWTVEKETQYGKTTWFYAVGHVHVRIIGRDLQDCIEMDVPCEASDNSDKLTNKLMTNAERCLYRTLYAIDEGDASDPETVWNENNFKTPANEQKPLIKRRTASDDPFFSH